MLVFSRSDEDEDENEDDKNGDYDGYLVMKVIQSWKLSSDESYLVMKVF